MDKELQALQQVDFLRGIENLEGASLLWEIRRLGPEETLWWQGEPAKELGIVCQGRLRVHINKENLAEIATGEVVGELATFTGDSRIASVSAIEESYLLLLSSEALVALREAHSSMYDRLLEVALQRVALRIHQMDRQIARIAQGEDEAPVRKEDGVLQQWFKRLTTVAPQSPPPAQSVLRKLPRLQQATSDEVQQILGAMQPHYVEQGKPLFLEGEKGGSVFLLVEGCIEVMRNVKRGMAERLATLYPGALLGTGALLLGERRNAGCVASKNTKVWVYEMTKEHHDSLVGNAGRLWKESLLAALAFQLRSADDRWVVLKQGQRPEQTDYDNIRGLLMGYQG